MWCIHQSAVKSSSEGASFPALQNSEKVGLFFHIREGLLENNVNLPDSNIPHPWLGAVQHYKPEN